MTKKFDPSTSAYEAWLTEQASQGIVWDGILIEGWGGLTVQA